MLPRIFLLLSSASLGCASALADAAPRTALTPEAESAARAASEPEPVVPPPAAEPVACAGEERIEATGLTILGEDGPAVRASGHCQVTLTSADLRGALGVEASEQAKVILRGGRVRGTRAAVLASGEATVSLFGTEVVGDVRLEGAADSASTPESDD